MSKAGVANAEQEAIAKKEKKKVEEARRAMLGLSHVSE